MRAQWLSLCLLSLSACFSPGLQRFSPPPMRPITNPNHVMNHVPVSMPTPKPHRAYSAPNSLWREGSQGFLSDLRARHVGDLVMVRVAINDNAQLANDHTRSRTGDRPNLLNTAQTSAPQPNTPTPQPGSQPASLTPASALSTLTGMKPEALSALIAAHDKFNDQGAGSIKRSEVLNVKVAAVVTQILPNGNFVISGNQETRVNNESRFLTIKGIIRPQDIDGGNEIAYERIANARISYGGRGSLSETQTPAYASRILKTLSPFNH